MNAVSPAFALMKITLLLFLIHHSSRHGCLGVVLISSKKMQSA